MAPWWVSPYWRGSDWNVTDPRAGLGRQRVAASPLLEDGSLKAGMVREGCWEERALGSRDVNGVLTGDSWLGRGSKE